MRFECVYTGVDGLDVAFRGALPANILNALERARTEAEGAHEGKELRFQGVPFRVLPHGLRGGYRYALDSGTTGAKLFVKASDDPEQWNLFARMSSAGLLTLGYEGARTYLEDCLRVLRAEVLEHAVNLEDAKRGEGQRGPSGR